MNPSAYAARILYFRSKLPRYADAKSALSLIGWSSAWVSA